MTPVRLQPAALQSRVKHSTTEPLRFRYLELKVKNKRKGIYIFELALCNVVPLFPFAPAHWGHKK